MRAGFAKGQLLSHYELIDFIGQGSMGRVYKARDTRLDRLVALKFLAPHLLETKEARDRFFREAQALSALSDPNIAVIYDIDQSEEQPFLALEYLEGGPLTTRIRGRKLPLEEIADLGGQLAAGLNHAHRNGIIHRDVKPANALFGREGVLKLVDFGLAKSLGSPGLATNSPCGTLAYMAPEQSRGETTDSRSDIFSLGVILYQMAAGKLPFEGTSSEEVMRKVLFEEPEPLEHLRPDLPAEFTSLVTQSLAKDPRRRTDSAERVLATLEQIKETSQTATLNSDETALPTIRSSGLSRKSPPKRKRWAMALACAALLVPIVAGTMMWKNMVKPTAVSKPDLRMVVVLPFESESSEVDAAEFSTGIQPVLSGLLVRTAQFKKSFWEPPTVDVREQRVRSTDDARRRLGADLVIGGNVVRGHETYKVVVHLTDAKTGRQVDSRIINVPRSQIAQLDDRLVSAALAMLGAGGGTPLGSGTQLAGVGGSQGYELCVRAEGMLRGYNGVSNVDAAERLLQEAVRVEGTTARNQTLLAEAYMQRFDDTLAPTDLERAQSYAKTARSLAGGQDVSVRMLNARILMDSGKPEQAAQELRSIVAADEGNLEAWRLLGLAYDRAEKTADAEAALRKAIEISPGYWPSHSNLGSLLFHVGRMTEAEQEMKKAAELAPEVARVHRNLGGLYVRTQRIGDAREQLNKALAIEPDFGTYLNLCTLEFSEARYDRAAAMCEQATKAAPAEVRAWGSLGDVYSVMQAREADARQAYGKALALAEAAISKEPGSPFLLCRIALYQAKLGRQAQARASAGKAIAANPVEGGNLWILARALESTGDRSAAVVLVAQALRKGYSYDDLKQEPDLAGLKNDPRLRPAK